MALIVGEMIQGIFKATNLMKMNIMKMIVKMMKWRLWLYLTMISLAFQDKILSIFKKTKGLINMGAHLAPLGGAVMFNHTSRQMVIILL